MSHAFRVVHDDDDIVVVDKAPGVLTVPTLKRERNTLVDVVAKHLRVREIFVVHRLDRDTSGLLVFAKSRRARDVLVEEWDEHERVYVAIVFGSVKQDDGVVESRLVTEKNLDRRSVRPGHVVERSRPRGARRGHAASHAASHAPEGERAVTRFRVVERVRGATLVECELETGRRNQIRVHMKDLGHPILGDDRYARDVKPHPKWRGGLALHARTLVLTQPRTRERLKLDAGLPAAFTSFLAAAR